MPNMPGHIWLASSGSTTALNSEFINLYGLSKEAFLSSADAVNVHLHATEKDIWLNFLPLFHVGGLSILARAHLVGAKVIDAGLSENSGSWSAKLFHKWIEESHATLTSLVPTQVYDLVKWGQKCPASLRAIVIGGARLGEDLYSSARELGFPLLPSYGLTECCSQVATASLDSLSHLVYPNLQILSHVEAQTENDGALSLKSPALFSAVATWRGGQLTDIQLRKGEWYKTADNAEIQFSPTSPERFLILHGRRDDLVKISGELVSLSSLNEIFSSLAGEKDFCMLAQPDSRRGFEVAVVLTVDSYPRSKNWIIKFNNEVLPVAKIRAAYFVKKIPRTDLGKIKTAELKNYLALG